MDLSERYPSDLALSTLTLAAGVIVLAVAVFLLVQAVEALLRPEGVRKFLGASASNAQAHFVELAVRIAAGLAFWHFAPPSAFPLAFNAFGAVLVLTSVALLCAPWRLDRRFAQRAVPLATRHMAPYSAGCLADAAAIRYGAFLG